MLVSINYKKEGRKRPDRKAEANPNFESAFAAYNLNILWAK